MSSTAVTVIVPGFDVAEYAEEALDSLRAQTHPHWTAVLVDDGSTDDTTRLFADAEADDPRFRFVRHDEQRGLGAARNSGLALVETPYTAFLDADDVMRPDALSRLVDTLDRSGSAFVVGAYVRLRPDAEGPGYTAGDVQPWVTAATDPAREGVSLEQHPAASGNIVAWSKLSRTDFWREHDLRFPEGRYYEDQVLAQRMYTLAPPSTRSPTWWSSGASGATAARSRNASARSTCCATTSKPSARGLPCFVPREPTRPCANAGN